MLRVVYSNAPEALLEVFAKELEATVGLPPRDVFARTQLIVASRPLEAWVKKHLAARAGIVANFDTWMLQRFVSTLIHKAFPGSKPLDGAVLRDLVLARLLDDANLEGRDLVQVQRYLAASAGDPRGSELRRVQLASQVGYLFEEYIFSRRQLLETWATTEPTSADLKDPLICWQRRLWRDVVAQAEGYVHPGRLLDVDPRKLVSPDQPLFVFGLSFVGTLFHELLAHVAKATDVHLYALNPCMEFWEDLPSVRDRRRALPGRADRVGAEALEGEDPFGLRTTEECRALTLWGRPGRESVRLLNEATQGRSKGLFVDPAKRRASLLTLLQRDILAREPHRTVPPKELDRSGDASIELINAPSLRRECEAIASRIWALLSEGPARGEAPLKLDDLTVLIAARDADAYVPPLLAAFKENHSLPAQLVGVGGGASAAVTEAAALLLELPLSRFTRADVLRVLTHPSVMARCPSVDPARWIEWVDTLGIFHGADHSDHQGTYIDRDVLNWDQGLKRLALGAFLTSEHDGVTRPFELGGEHYLPHSAGRVLEDGVGDLLLLARSLIADARALTHAKLSPRQWADVLAAFVEIYVIARDELEQKALDRCLRAVRSLSERELGERPLSFLLARELVQNELASAGAPLHGGEQGGVRISTLSATRGLPSRVTFVIGLSEGAFPSGEKGNPLDLRARKPRAGDASPREKDEYLFLEALLVTREKLVLSWVGREEKSGEEKHPSPVVVELLRLLEEGYARPKEHQVPLWRADTESNPDFLPSRSAIEERHLRVAGEHLREEEGPLPPETDAREVLAALSPKVRARLEPALRIPVQPPVAEPAEVEQSWRISLSALRQYLECPLQGSARVRLRLRADDEEDRLEQRDETFGASRRVKVSTLRGAFLDGWRACGGQKLPEDWSAFWDGRTERLVAEGALPVGVFLEAERELGLGSLASWSEFLAPLVSHARLGVTRFGPAEEHEVNERIAPPIVLSLPGARVELFGATQPMIGDDRTVLLFARSSRGQGERQKKEALKAFLDRAALLAAGLVEPGEHAVSFVYSDGIDELRLAPFTAEEATALLTQVVTDLLTADNGLLMPIEAVFASDLCGGELPLAEAVAKKLDPNGRSFVCAGPIRDLDRYGPPDDPDARELFARRLALFARCAGLLGAPQLPAKSKKRSAK